MARKEKLFLGALFLFILIIGMLYTNTNSSIFEGAENQTEKPTKPTEKPTKPTEQHQKKQLNQVKNKNIK